VAGPTGHSVSSSASRCDLYGRLCLFPANGKIVCVVWGSIRVKYGCWVEKRSTSVVKAAPCSGDENIRNRVWRKQRKISRQHHMGVWAAGEPAFFICGEESTSYRLPFLRVIGYEAESLWMWRLYNSAQSRFNSLPATLCRSSSFPTKGSSHLALKSVSSTSTV
jgi:hypothetical protein